MQAFSPRLLVGDRVALSSNVGFARFLKSGCAEVTPVRAAAAT
jgi:hypothetical protein